MCKLMLFDLIKNISCLIAKNFLVNSYYNILNRFKLRLIILQQFKNIQNEKVVDNSCSCAGVVSNIGLCVFPQRGSKL
jgi:hypothetical protein